MTKANFPPNTERDLLFGVLALQLDFIGRTDFQRAVQAWSSDRSRPLSHVLIDRQMLAPRRRALLDDLVREYLVQHDMDPSRGLAAACAARESPIDVVDLAAPALRGNLGTLPAAPSTLPSTDGNPPIARPAPATEQRYRIIRPHARGALGEVFVAHDEELNREVALKEIQDPYVNHEDSRARFVLEAEITGNLEHPGVVPVYSLGTHADGRPFYTMRFIKGESLQQAISRFHQADVGERDFSERAMSLRGLLSRFVATCNTVAYAHARGVIHRDIKPSNVMLGPYGETLVVDWGLAKAFDQPMTPDSVELPVHPLSAHSTTATMLGQAVGTPAFMPPEQATGRVDQVGPPSDVYSLGATLYNLLAGVPPFSGSASDVLLKVSRHEFLPPRRVKRQIPAALEAIVLKAMAFLPEQRYGTVSELADDVERWLADEPTLAYRERLLERSQRWMRRHKPMVYAAAALLLTAVVGLAVGLFAVNRERAQTKTQARIAEDNLSLAKEAIDQCFVIATDDATLQQARMRGVRKMLLEKALSFYEKAKVRRPEDDTITSEFANNKFRVARITEEIDSKAKAIESYQHALEVYERLAKDQPDDQEVLGNLGRILNNLGTLQSDEEAIQSLRQAVEIRRQLRQRHPSNADYQSELAATYSNLGVVRQRMGDFADAARDFDRARELLDHLVKKYPKNARYQANRAAIYHNQGDLLAHQPETEREALQAYDLALKSREQLARAYPAVGDYRADLGRTLLAKAALLTQTGDVEFLARADECTLEALKLFRDLVHEDREVVSYRIDLAQALMSSGRRLARDKDQFEVSLNLQKEAFEILESLHERDRELIEHWIDLAGACLNLGHTFKENDARAAEAIPWFNRAVEHLQAIQKENPNQRELPELLGNAYWGRGEALVKSGKPLEGLADLRLAKDGTRPGTPERFLYQKDYAFALCKAGRHREALREIVELQKAGVEKGRSRGDLYYELACIAALAAKAVLDDSGLKRDAERDQLYRHAADESIDLLFRAQQHGFFDSDANRAHFEQDSDFAEIRKYKKFQAFVKQIGPRKAPL